MSNKLVIVMGLLFFASAPVICAAQGMDRNGEMGGGPGMDADDERGEAPGWGGGRPGGMGGAGGAGGRGRAGNMMGMKGGMGGSGMLDEAEVLAVIKKHDPAFAARLAGQKTAAPKRYRMTIMLAGRTLGMSRLENDESAAGDAVRLLALESDARELAAKYNKAGEADRAGIKAGLKLKVAELFDLRLKGQELRLKRMEKEMAKLKSGLDARKAGKAKIVDERVGQMTGESVGW